MNNPTTISQRVLLLLVATLAGCSILPESEPVRLLDPAPAPGVPEAAPADWTLDVVRPETDPARDSTRVLVRTADGRLQVHGRMRWISAPPDLLRTLLVRYLRDYALVREANAASGSAERLLAIDLRRFELDATAALEATVALEARLYSGPRRALIGRARIEARHPARDTLPAATNAAFEAALGDALTRLGAWLVEHPAR